uniref:Skp1-related protein n=1 Tax=Parascaris univalens TaxID=6257 RepID=A0A914ZRD7_PARUN
MIRLKSSDNEIIEVDSNVIKVSASIHAAFPGPEIDFEGSSEVEKTSQLIPVDGVEGSILRKVVEWCEHHKSDAVASQETDNFPEGISDPWDVQFFNVDKEILFKTILAANALGIEGLLNAACKAVAKMIEGKSAEEMECILTLEDQFTPEEEEQIRKERPWPWG